MVTRKLRGLLLILAGSAVGCNSADAGLDDIRLPAGFAIEGFVDVPGARSLALGDDGVIFVGTRRNSVYAVVPGSAGEPRVAVVADDLDRPNGVTVLDGDLYVAEPDRILRFPRVHERLRDGTGQAPETVAPLRSQRSHAWRYLRAGPDGRLYTGIGANCNICEDEGGALILALQPDGSSRQVIAEGVRNTVGFDWHPDDGSLWFTDNGRDRLGDDRPPDELNRLSSQGAHFGYPWCHGGFIADPDFGRQRKCDEFVPPVRALGPHVAAIGMRFYSGSQFPERYRNHIFIAEHGSWNRSKRIGYRVTHVYPDASGQLQYDVFADGWLRDERVSGRPVDVLVYTDGSLIVSDDEAGRLYRIRYIGE